MKIVAMVSAQGTACPETALRDAEDTPDNRARLEAQFCNTADPDAPLAGSWTDVSDNDAFATPKQPLFRNFYNCYRCHHEWDDVWPAQSDDDCPNCGARHVSPYRSEDAD